MGENEHGFTFITFLVGCFNISDGGAMQPFKKQDNLMKLFLLYLKLEEQWQST